MLELDAGEIAEQDCGEVPAGAGAERGVVQLAGMRLGVVDQVRHRAERGIRRHQQHILRGRNQHDRVEILERIEVLARLQRDVDPQRLRAEMQGIAVGRGLRRSRGADIAAPARPVLDHHVLAPGLGELLREDAAQRVDGAAGRERNQNADRAVGIGLGACAAVHRQRGRDQQQAAPDPQSHALLPIGFLFR